MSAQADFVHEILVEELRDVTLAMIDAGSAADEAASVLVDSQGKRHPRMTSEGDRLTAIWQAMLAAKLGVRR